MAYVQIDLMLRPEEGRSFAGRKGSASFGGRHRTPESAVPCESSTTGPPDESVFEMLFVYSKTEQGDLTAAQVSILGRPVWEEFK